MAVALHQIGQIAVTVDDVDVAEEFYTQSLGLRKLFRFGNLLFVDCAGVRLLIEKSNVSPFAPTSSIVYFKSPDLRVTVAQLQLRGVAFVSPPQFVATLEDHDLWMAFFKDSSGNTLALMQEAPQGYKPTPDL